MKELTELFEARAQAPGVPYAVATVLKVEGSSYRRPGARMLVSVHGRVAGSVSGGCLEKSVISEARACLLDGRARLLSFDTTDQDDLAFGTSLGCEGRILIGVERLEAGEPWLLSSMATEVRQRREPVIIITRFSKKGKKVEIVAEALSPLAPMVGVAESWRDVINTVSRTKKTGIVGDVSGQALIEWWTPPLALILLGAGPDVPPLVKLACDLGHEVTVIDRRADFAIAAAFPGAHRVVMSKPHDLAGYLRPDDRTVAVLMNHHYDTDRDALKVLLPLGLPYIALLGPRRRTDRILEDLRSSGSRITKEARATLHAPAGLDLGGETPEQIALSILAEIQAALAGRSGSSLRLKSGPIHAENAPVPEPLCPLPA